LALPISKKNNWLYLYQKKIIGFIYIKKNNWLYLYQKKIEIGVYVRDICMCTVTLFSFNLFMAIFVISLIRVLMYTPFF